MLLDQKRLSEYYTGRPSAIIAGQPPPKIPVFDLTPPATPGYSASLRSLSVPPRFFQAFLIPLRSRHVQRLYSAQRVSGTFGSKPRGISDFSTGPKMNPMDLRPEETMLPVKEVRLRCGL